MIFLIIISTLSIHLLRSSSNFQRRCLGLQFQQEHFCAQFVILNFLSSFFYFILIFVLVFFVSILRDYCQYLKFYFHTLILILYFYFMFFLLLSFYLFIIFYFLISFIFILFSTLILLCLVHCYRSIFLLCMCYLGFLTWILMVSKTRRHVMVKCEVEHGRLRP